MAKLSRRTFLQLSAALAAGACTDDPTAPEADDFEPSGEPADEPAERAGEGAPGPAPAAVPGVDLDALPVRAGDFPYGVMAGDATATSVILWTKFIGDGTLAVQIEEERGPRGMAVASRPLTGAERGDAGFMHVDVIGLQAGRRYRYAFFVIEAGRPVGRGPFGRVRAAIAPGALEVVTFAGTSCTHQLSAPYPLLGDAARRRVDFFLHGGDHVYTDAGDNAVTLAQYRAKYATAWGTSGMSALHGSTGMVLTWDDHEILNNWNPETFPAARLDTARRAFFEHRATRRNPAAPNRLWRSLVWGKTLEILVLDVRSERKPSTRETANAQFISPAQMAWLKGRLARSAAVFKLVVTSVPITNFPGAAAGEVDKWEGYPAQREEILDFVEARALKGVWWLSGDLHFGCIGGIGPTGARRRMREVLMGPGGTNARSPSLPAGQFDRVVGEKNYTVFRADPIKRELTVTFVGAGGKIFERTYDA
jgi:alkaline phosphatase D